MGFCGFYSSLLFLSEVDSLEVQAGAQQVHFTVSLREADPAQQNLFCCLYKIQDGRYSAFSPYLQLDAQKGYFTRSMIKKEKGRGRMV